MKKYTPPNLLSAQERANTYARQYLTNNKIDGLGSLDEASHKTAILSVANAIMQGWAAGYMRRDEEVRPK